MCISYFQITVYLGRITKRTFTPKYYNRHHQRTPMPPSALVIISTVGMSCPKPP
ncbi:MFS domain-containing protein [Psidium guajava]|nr:MFS domain-containing protein [Psidium guajava]